jgi:hypothetical protein
MMSARLGQGENNVDQQIHDERQESGRDHAEDC